MSYGPPSYLKRADGTFFSVTRLRESAHDTDGATSSGRGSEFKRKQAFNQPIMLPLSPLSEGKTLTVSLLRQYKNYKERDVKEEISDSRLFRYSKF